MLIPVVVFAVLARYLVSLHSYSGMSKPPMFGDFEAQRHWCELTINLPPTEWYTNSTNNDLMYWGLDYPPLTAYVSWGCGKLGSFLEPESMALYTSRGYETESNKVFMRLTVLALDIAIFISSIVCFVQTYLKRFRTTSSALLTGLILLQPAYILIDHGHFQYNCVMLGLTVWAICFIIKGHYFWGSVMFCLALNFKQMALYFSPAFFFFLLGRCIFDYRDKVKISTTLPPLVPFSIMFRRLAVVASAVIITFVLCWLPWLDSLESASQVFRRLFPIERGLFEDKVANFWCALSVVIKFRQLFDLSLLVRFSIVATLIGFLPSCLDCFVRPSIHRFLLTLMNSSLSFFLFSFQVHEKSILLPLLPVSLLMSSFPLFGTWFGTVSLFSLYPLLVRDGLVVPYWSFLISYFIVAGYISIYILPPFDKLKQNQKLGLQERIQLYSMAFTLICIVALHIFEVIYVPPQKWKDLHVLLNSVFCFCCFFVSWIIGVVYQLFAPHIDSDVAPTSQWTDSKME
eukprot:GILJ01010675.1.p1 GENE.GILJ01010675.1~~GILJ01010675.1.p1  ORF type:complete len:523 (+),score=18.04 GILJ01010675.1:25-1569(+)